MDFSDHVDEIASNTIQKKFTVTVHYNHISIISYFCVPKKKKRVLLDYHQSHTHKKRLKTQNSSLVFLLCFENK